MNYNLTVRELIEKLQTFPPDHKVEFESDEYLMHFSCIDLIESECKIRIWVR